MSEDYIILICATSSYACFPRRSIWFLAVGLVVVKLISVFTGLTMYARYHKCDPITAHVSFFFFSYFFDIILALKEILDELRIIVSDKIF